MSGSVSAATIAGENALTAAGAAGASTLKASGIGHAITFKNNSSCYLATILALVFVPHKGQFEGIWLCF